MNYDEDNVYACEIDTRVFGKDFDIADKEIYNQQISEANQSDEDEEMAAKFGY